MNWLWELDCIDKIKEENKKGNYFASTFIELKMLNIFNIQIQTNFSQMPTGFYKK